MPPARQQQIREILDAARARSRRPAAVSSILAGDLEAIIHNAMNKEPERRYRSVRQFAEDLERYLGGLPVTARPQTWCYRAQKFTSRHKAGVAAGVAVAVLFAAGIAAIARESAIARAERARAERRFHDTRDLANALVFDVLDAIKDLRGSAPARRLAAQKGMKYLDSLATDASAGLAVQLDLVEGYLRIGDLEGNPYSANRGDPKIARESLGKALSIAERAAVRDAANAKVQRALARSRQRLGELLPVLGKTEEGLANLRAAVPYAERAVSLSKSSEPIFLDTLARACHATGDRAKAIATEEKARALAPPTPGRPPSSLRRMLESHAANFRR